MHCWIWVYVTYGEQTKNMTNLRKLKTVVNTGNKKTMTGFIWGNWKRYHKIDDKFYLVTFTDQLWDCSIFIWSCKCLMLGVFAAALALVLGVWCLVENKYLQVLGVSEFFWCSSEVLGFNSSSCCSFIQVLGVCSYFLCRFFEVLGFITKIGEASGKC